MTVARAGFTPIAAITGADGFLGWHLRCRLVSEGSQFVSLGREQLTDPESARDLVASSDVVFHLAGVNRDVDDAIRVGNTDAASRLAVAIDQAEQPPTVVYANSVKAGQPGAYGESKAEAAQILREACSAAGSRFVDVQFPHLFGEFGRPRYNSGVTTFANELARGASSTVNDGQLELLHVQDAVGLMLEAARSEVSSAGAVPVRAIGRETSVASAYGLLAGYAETYCNDRTFPIISGRFELHMFNMLRSQMWPTAYPYPLVRHADQRGAFFEATRAFGQGQTSISTTVPGVVRGEHFHFDKVERFVVISGDALIRVRRLFDDVVHEFAVSGDQPAVIDMPPLCTHDITNTGQSELVTMFWSHDHFDPQNADTYPLPVVGEELPA